MCTEYGKLLYGKIGKGCGLQYLSTAFENAVSLDLIMVEPNDSNRIQNSHSSREMVNFLGLIIFVDDEGLNTKIYFK